MPHSEYTKHYINFNKNDLENAKKDLSSRFEKIRDIADINLIKKYIVPGSFLDFPIGTGRIFPNFIDSHQVFGADISKIYVQNAKNNFPQIKDNFFLDDLMDIKTNLKFDNIVYYRASAGVFNFYESISNLSKLLNHNGRLIFNVNNNYIDIDKLFITTNRNNLSLVKRNFNDGLQPNKIIRDGFIKRYFRSFALKLIEKDYFSDQFWVFISNNYPGSKFCTYIFQKNEI